MNRRVRPAGSSLRSASNQSQRLISVAISVDRGVGQEKPAPLPSPDHLPKLVEKITGRIVAIAELAGALKDIPGDLEGLLK